MIIDAHAHLFNPAVIDNTLWKTAMTRMLGFQLDDVRERVSAKRLREESESADVGACFLLPTAKAHSIRKVNDTFLDLAAGTDFLHTACTLHPDLPRISEEIKRIRNRGARGIKLCSFSQGFSLEDEKTFRLFDGIRDAGLQEGDGFFVILDTFYRADEFFGTPPANTPTPARVGALVRNFPEITFVAAHMGGLTAPFSEVCHHLPPCENLYLDTSNAAHTLSEDEFIHLLKGHGPERIIFGTDWPWFAHGPEIRLIDRLMEKAGYAEPEKTAVFGDNMSRLLNLHG